MKARLIFLRRVLPLLFLMVALSSRAGDAVLTVTGEVKTPLKLTLAELQALPGTKVNAADHDGKTATYEGVALHEILKQAGAPQGESLRGDAMRLCVLVKAADGYQAVFSLAELDPLFTDKVVLLAFRRDGAELDAQAGPLRLVVPEDKRHGRWVRRVTEVEIVRVGAGGARSHLTNARGGVNVSRKRTQDFKSRS